MHVNLHIFYSALFYNYLILCFTSLCVHACMCVVSCVQLFETPWTIAAHQAPLSKEFSKQEYWSGILFLSPGDLPYPGIKPTSLTSPTLQVGSLPAEPPEELLLLYHLSHLGTIILAQS